ncbi:M14 family metallopeptidase [Flocculibacter collagenilyticus]|uniref:M14 family metallopeptidase n=1 Tax=Flocculibacter collagenilyticus TaxID=2744479 RepID=UPI0018F3CF10|nr:M14-type cytosolic carboxypeptidase [Flocculibacter collagenilyticus]
MKITSNFDSGNIEVVALAEPNDIQLKIIKDNQSDFFQWFHFRLQTTAQTSHKLAIINAHESAYVKGWEDYYAVASYDRENWFRVDTKYDGKSLVIEHTPEFESVFYAYFAPYSYERHLNLIHQSQISPFCQLEDLGETLDGRDMSLLIIGEPDENKKKIWMTARQHPGETMAEWFVEGFLSRILDEEDGTARKLLEEAVFYVVPNMNPDGSARGHLRTNAVGSNLNREWQTPSLEKSPEVYHVREKMLEIGVDMYLDVHGDEALPYNFVAGCEGNPSYDERHKALEDAFKHAYMMATPEFQDEFGYDKDEPGKANLTVAANWVGEQFKCLSYTIEMPFKDNADLPDELYGWSDIRSIKLGKDVLPAILAVVPKLR